MIIGVVPARAKSKRVPGKNVRHFAGKPLVLHTVEAAIDSGVIDSVLCNTDSDEIAELVNGLPNVEVQERPPALADDHATAMEVSLRAVERFADSDTVVQLLPTSPLRRSKRIADAAEVFSREPARSLVSVGRPAGYEPWWTVALADGHDRLDWLHATSLERRSQDLPDLAFLSGAMSFATIGDLRRTRSFHLLDPRPYVMSFAEAIDIDTEDDWRLAEALEASL